MGREPDQRKGAANNGRADPAPRAVETEPASESGTSSTAGLPAIEGYKPLRELHHGGQGVVYEAVQLSTRRKVAIKVLLEGPYASESAKRRFEREIELAAQLKHPHIIEIFDSGVTSDGRQFCVMDYVRGKPLRRYVRDQKLPLEQTLEIFATVCQAVQYAHQRGVIHRDLKPSNILVDTAGDPKVLDFGLAKMMAAPVDTLVSMTGQIVGTLPYMSPEQTRGNPDEIDIRTDVYSLGVIFYEVLTGQYPYPVVGQMADVLKHIAETPPALPSKSWSPDSGVLRRRDRKRARQGGCPLDDEIQTILLKALAKERERRYQSAGELARDLGHYLSGEAIEAKRDSHWYILKKTLKRYKAPAAVAAALLVVVMGFGIWMSVLYRQADRLRLEAEQERAATAREAETAQAINAFFNDMLASVDPMQLRMLSGFGPGQPMTSVPAGGFSRDVSVAEMMRRAGARIQEPFGDKPGLAAELRETLGTTFLGLGLYEDARPQLEAALENRRRTLGPDHPDTLRSQLQLAELLSSAGRWPEGEPLVRSALAGMRRVFGEEHPNTLTCQRVLAWVLLWQDNYDQSEPIFRRTLELQRRVLGAEHRDTLMTMCQWSISLMFQGKVKEAVALSRDAYDISHRTLSPDDCITIWSETLRGWWYMAEGKYEAAESLSRGALDKSRRILGEKHPNTLIAMRGLAQSLVTPQSHQEREQLHRRALAGLRETLGERHYLTMQAKSELVSFLWARGRFEEARTVVAQGLEAFRREAQQPEADAEVLNNYAWNLLICKPVDLRDPETALSVARRAVERSGAKQGHILDTLAEAYRQTGDLEQAIRTQSQALAALGPEETGWQVQLGATYVRLLLRAGRAAEAEQFLSESLTRFRKQLGRENPQLAVMLNFLGVNLANEDLHAQALLVFREALELNRKLHGDEHETVVLTLGNLAYSHSTLGDYASAVEARREVLAVQRKLHGDESPEVARALNLLGVELGWSGSQSEAESLFREALRISRKLYGEDGPGVAQVKRNLAGTLVGLGELVEGEQLAREALAWCRRVHGEKNMNTAGVMRVLGLVLLEKGDPEQAEPFLRECVEVLRSLSLIFGLEEAKAWRVARAESILGECLTALQRFDQVEPVLVGSYEALLAARGEAFADTRAALERVVKLYDAWGKPDQAAEYRALLPAEPPPRDAGAP